MPLTTLGPTITSAGITVPSYDEILQSLTESYQSIFGADSYLGADSQDGQLLAVFARAQSDTNDTIVAIYNSFRPSYAQGASLSSLVAVNGITRRVATFSTAVGTVTGTVGTSIVGGQVSDENGNRWNLPAQVDIPISGAIDVNVTAVDPGNIVAAAGTINIIETPVFGWQTFASSEDAIPGQPIETDAQLRVRQRTAASLPAVSPLAGVLAAVERLAGVTRAATYENDSGGVDVNGLPAHSISVIVEGGDLLQIAGAIGQKKTPGAATFGTETQTYTDPNTGVDYDINFFVLDYSAIAVAITLTPLSGWSSSTAALIQAAVAAYVNSLAIGEEVVYGRLWGPAYLNGADEGKTYLITALTLNAALVDVVVPFNKAASMQTSDVAITVS